MTRHITSRHLRLVRPEDAERAAARAGIGAIEQRIGTAAAYHLVANDPAALEALGAGDTVRLHERLAELVEAEAAR